MVRVLVMPTFSLRHVPPLRDVNTRTHFVANETNLHPFAVGVIPNALHPVRDVLKCVRVGNIVHQHDPVGASVVRLRDLVKSLLG